MMAGASTVIWTTVISTISLLVTFGVGLFIIGTRWAKLSGRLDLLLFRQDATDKRLDKIDGNVEEIQRKIK